MMVYRALCGDAIRVGALLRGHQDGGLKVTETEVTKPYPGIRLTMVPWFSLKPRMIDSVQTMQAGHVV